jgi:hypothetical protein
MAITLRNTSKRRAAGPYNLPAQQYCADGEDRCHYVDMQAREHNPQTGEVGVRPMRKRISPSLRFEPGEVKTDLPDTVLTCPEIAGAVARGELAVVEVPPPQPG